MKEVSCRAFDIFWKPLASRGIPVERLVDGTNLTVSTLRDKQQRVDWADLVAITHNVARFFDEEGLREIGRAYFRTPMMRFMSVAARLRFTPLEFYRFINEPKANNNQLVTCIIPTQREISEHELEVDLVVAEPYPVCWEFFIITSGNFIEMPRLLGYPAAKVELTRLPRGARFHVTIPKKTPFLTQAQRVVTYPFTIRQAGRELQEAHDTLHRRYEQLEEARTVLDRQATQLRTAHMFNHLVQRDLDLTRTIATAVTALVADVGFAWAELAVDGEARVASGTRGTVAPLRHPLEARTGQTIGELSVEPAAGADRAGCEELLALVVPALALGIQNAQYRTNLERLVDERTAELQKARDQLAGTVDQLREAQGARERFFGNISHEIRTPLSIIMLAATDIEHRAGAHLDPRAKQALHSITDASRKLVRLVDELLLLAAGQEGKLRTHPEPTDLAALVQQVVAAWRPATEVAGLELHAALPPALVAMVDPVAIERVVTNLMSNAVKFTPRGGRIDVELVLEPAGLRLSVLDTGPGISEDLAGRLFGRFERAEGDHGRRKEGTGLGLSLAKQLVEAHGGTIRAVSRFIGSELRVTLPPATIVRETVRATPRTLRLVEDSVADDALPAGTVLQPPGLSKGTILIAEDDVRLAESLARLLAEDYTVVVAHDGVHALELVRPHQPQMLIADVDMPGLDGIALSRRFREVTGDRLAPIIIVSAMLDLRTRVAGLEAGAVDYVTKPFDPVELLARVRAQFDMRDLAVRLHRAEQLSTLGILTSGLAHELRNPANGVVNAIAPLVELLPPELTSPDSAVGQLLEVVGGCAQQIASLSRQLLGFRNSGIELELRPANVRELVQHALSLAQSALAGVDVRTRVAAGGALMCAPPLVTQVLTNLLENAGHAAARGGWVDVSAVAEGGSITVEVGDSGPGVPVELRERVFEPFFTTKPAGVGTGLGLSVARAIVHRHGGSLDIRDRNGRPTFVLTLPNYAAIDIAADAS